MSLSHIKVVALDVYGTILAVDDFDYAFPPREELENFLRICEERQIKVVTSSDAFTGNVKNDLEIAFKLVPKKGLSLGRFDGFFQMNAGEKDFSEICAHYGIAPKELLVIGDRFDKDISGALKIEANVIHCPAFGINAGSEWNFGNVNLD